MPWHGLPVFAVLDWKQTIRERLPLLELSAKREAEIVEELAQDLERRYQEARAEGASAEEARAHALEQISNSEELRKRLIGAGNSTRLSATKSATLVILPGRNKHGPNGQGAEREGVLTVQESQQGT